MTKRKSRPQEQPLPTRLKVSRQDAADRLAERAALGKQLLQRKVEPGEVQQLESEVEKWADYNQTLIGTLFQGDELPFEYSTARPIFISSPYDSVFVRARHLASSMESQIRELESIIERLNLYDEPPQRVAQHQTAPAGDRKRIFVVHGKDEAALAVVDTFLRQVGLEPVVLREQPNAGRTIIEKFEGYADVARGCHFDARRRRQR
jgi:hypothetical protein